MVKKQRPTIVTVVVVLNIILGLVYVITGFYAKE